MRIVPCTQGEQDWLDAKRGLPSASNFHMIITPGGKPSKQAAGYAYKLATEILLGQTYDEQGRPIGDIGNLPAIVRGKALEPTAAAFYEFDTGWKTIQVGLIVRDDGRAGASPDRIVETGTDLRGGVEFKCPYPHTHLEYVVAGFGTDYIVQAQGQNWCCDFDFVDRVSFLPGAPGHRERTFRDEGWMKLFDVEMSKFYELLDRTLEKARSAGDWVPMPVVTQDDYVRPRGFQGRERHDPTNPFNHEFDGDYA